MRFLAGETTLLPPFRAIKKPAGIFYRLASERLRARSPQNG
ncbi:hypothetical protein HMPREF3220_03500 [Citrobacter koseri]|nr:hypothetical protein HMPREF3220_03500 [Citrobacter koseri]